MPGIAVLLLAIIYLLVGFYPFNWQPLPKRAYNNGAVVTDSSAQFKSPGILRTSEAPEWLEPVIAASTLRVLLEVQSIRNKQYGPARIFTISSAPRRRNLTVGQRGDDLAVRVRTPVTSLNGHPEHLIEDVFSDKQWHRVEVLIDPAKLVIRVDDETVDTINLPRDPLSNWATDYNLALGNELQDDRHWLGNIRKAVVEADGKRIDYLAKGALEAPSTITLSEREYTNRLPRIQMVPFSMKYTDSPWQSIDDWAVNLIGFLPFGFFLMRAFSPRCSILFAVSVCALVSVSIEAGQILLSSRFTSSDDLILNTLGGAIGALISRYTSLLKLSRVTLR